MRPVYAILLATALVATVPSPASAQVLTQNGSLMGWVQDHIANRIPLENTEAFDVPTAAQRTSWRNVMNALLDENYQAVSDTLAARFSNYRIVQFTDTLFGGLTYYMLRETYPVSYGWGTFVYFPSWQRDITVAVPHPLNDENTPFEGIDLFQYTGARLYVLAGTHRCANAALSACDGTTGVCNNGVQQAFRVSDMAHVENSAFQVAHEAMFAESPNAWFFNVHGHNDNDCADIFLSSGRADDVRPSVQALRDSLVARGVFARHTGDGTACGLSGATNTQGRLVNGSNDPCGTANVSNTGRFFHIEQNPAIRREQAVYRILIEEIAELVPRSFQTVDLPPFPEIVLNEFLPHPRSPNGDANGNGSVNGNTDEFFELVNGGSSTVDLSGWVMADFRKDRFTFPSGARLLRGQAAVVFGPAAPVGSFGGARVYQAADSLSLANSSDTIVLKNAAGATVWRYSYSNSDTSISRVRNPEITGPFAAHTAANPGLRFSPGTKADGTPFLSNAVLITTAGWRMLSAPSSSFALQELSTQTPVQGIGNGFDKNLYTGYNGSTWTAPADLTGSLTPGRGFILYVFNNSLAGSRPLPLTLAAPGSPPSGDVVVPLHTSGDRFNLVGNPFAAPIDLTQMSVQGGVLASSVGQVWNPQTGSYVTTTALGNRLTAWQGMMIENSTAASLTFPAASVSSGGTFHGKVVIGPPLAVIHATIPGGTGYDAVFAVFTDSVEHLLQARRMPALADQPVSLALVEGNSSWAQRSLPRGGRLQLKVTVQTAGEVRLTVDQPENPTLVDRLVFDSGETTLQLAFDSGETRVLSLKRSAATAAPSARPFTTGLEAAFPNPFNPETRIRYRLAAGGPVRLELYSLSGQQVLVLDEGLKPPGAHTAVLKASGLSSGVYLVKLTTTQGLFTQKITLLK